MKSRAAALVALVVLAGCGGGGTLDEQGLEKEVESIQSFAAEGALLARDVADGKSTVSFARVHAGELAEQAAKLAQTLRTAQATPTVEDDVAQAAELAADVGRTLDEFEQAPGDAEQARGIQRKLEQLARDAKELAAA